MANCGPALPCCPFSIERAVHIASQALPAAGAELVAAAFALPPGAKEIVFWCTYTRGAVGGYPGISIQWGNGIEVSFEAVLDLGSFAVAAPIGDTNIYRNELLGIAPQDANAYSWELPYKVPAGSTQVQMVVREVGITATPGTFAAALTGAGGGGW